MSLPPHGGQLRRIAVLYGIPEHEILDLSANINPEGPPASVLAALRHALADPVTLTLYPDLELQSLKQSIATYLSRPPASAHSPGAPSIRSLTPNGWEVSPLPAHPTTAQAPPAPAHSPGAPSIRSLIPNGGEGSPIPAHPITAQAPSTSAHSPSAPSIRSLTPNGWEGSPPPAHPITAQNISVANGFVPLLQAAIRTRKIRRCLLPVPAFSEYRRTLELNQVEVIPFPLASGAFLYRPDELLAALDRTGSDAILLANPQNPSGLLTPSAVLHELIAGTQATILLDEAFIDYAPAEALTTAPATYPNLIVFRSVTKFFAMPGLRVAYCVAPSDTAHHIDDMLAPWPVSTLAVPAVQAALADEPYHHTTRTLNQVRRAALISGLEGLGLRPYPAAANFLLLPLPSDAAAIWTALLRDHHIHLRACTNFEALPGPHLRTAVRTEAENDRLVAALKAIL